MAGKGIPARIIIGLMLIVFGALFLLDNYDIYYFPFEILSWQYFLIALGLLFLIISKNKTAGIVLVAIGLFNIIPELWPLIFVIIGLLIILRKHGYRRCYSRGYQDTDFDKKNFSPGDESAEGKDIIEEVSIFGGSNRVVNSENFRGGSVLSIFGGSEINLLNSKLAEGENILEVTFIFGGSTLIVPQDWKVELDVMTIFGGFGDKRRKDPNMVYDERKKLVVKGFILFGGGEIKNY
jgi:predicted membrane protein